MDWLRLKLELKEMKDWYKIGYEDLLQNGGSGLISKYNGSPSLLLTSVYPEHKWNLEKFSTVPKRHWDRSFMDWLGLELGFNKMDDWYRITSDDISKKGGSGSLNNSFNGSPSLLVTSIYPEHKWDIHQFSTVPKRYWSNTVNQRSIMDWLGIKLGFKKKSDWYKITCKDILHNGGSGLLARFKGSPSLSVTSVYPEHKWKKSSFEKHKQMKKFSTTIMLRDQDAQ